MHLRGIREEKKACKENERNVYTYRVAPIHWFHLLPGQLVCYLNVPHVIKLSEKISKCMFADDFICCSQWNRWFGSSLPPFYKFLPLLHSHKHLKMPERDIMLTAIFVQTNNTFIFGCNSLSLNSPRLKNAKKNTQQSTFSYFDVSENKNNNDP